MLRKTIEEGLSRLAAAVREGAERGEADARRAAGEGRDSLAAELDPAELWLARVRAGLVALLGFLEDEPQLGRLLVGHGRPVGTAGLEGERRAMAMLAALLAGARLAGRRAHRDTSRIGGLHEELVVGGLMAAIATRMRDRGGERLVELAPSLTAFAATSYLSYACVREELGAGVPSTESQVASSANATAVGAPRPGIELFKRLPGRTAHLCIRATSAPSRGTGWSRQSALFQTGDVGGSPGGGLADRSLCNREDKGVVHK